MLAGNGSNGPLSGGHWVIDITNRHFIHAGLERGPEFLSILAGNDSVCYACAVVSGGLIFLLSMWPEVRVCNVNP